MQWFSSLKETGQIREVLKWLAEAADSLRVELEVAKTWEEACRGQGGIVTCRNLACNLLLNLSYEPETVHQMVNEIFYNVLPTMEQDDV